MPWPIILLLLSCPLITMMSNVIMPLSAIRASDWGTLLHLTDCQLPCWISIVPGETTIGEARTIIEDVYADTALYTLEQRAQTRIIVSYLPLNYKLRIDFTTNDDEITDLSVIRSLSLEPFYESDDTLMIRPTISEIQAIIGEPTVVRLASGINDYGISLVYSDGLVYVALRDLECDQVLPNQEVYAIGIVSQRLPEEKWPSDPQVWRGYNVCYNFERRATY